MLKRAMDVFYASVGTALQVTGTDDSNRTTDWQLTLVAAALSSFYSLTGASHKAADLTSSGSARSLIQNAWGMVSWPAVKNLSLQTSKLLKGAAVADRIEIGGVACFVLSKEPVPELAAAIRSFGRKNRQQLSRIHKLSTIDEQAIHCPETRPSSKPFARPSTSYRQRDVILHLTGGGFFAHIVASDLPYLLDWSNSTGAVVICPEYALLPEHTFPDALLQVENVYRTLLTQDAVSILGFEVNRLILTGESTGANLAAAVCVKIGMELIGLPTCIRPDNAGPSSAESVLESIVQTRPLRLPSALMLSCPILNLSLELGQSSATAQDPVLPTGLLTAISDAYLPSGEMGVSKKHPLVSPLYACDAVLQQFPPTLIFSSSNDPLLDDSVIFNQRLRQMQVDSRIRAAHNLPHAYLGLGTAGFPEASQLQLECQDWLVLHFTRESTESSLGR